jgi:hypothetical protein
MKEIEFIKEQIKLYKLQTKSRKRKYVYKRFYCIYILNKCGMNLKDIDKIFGFKTYGSYYAIRMHIRYTKYKDSVYFEEIAPIIAASKGNKYETKFKVIAKETQKDISILIKIAFEVDLINNFKDYMTFDELTNAFKFIER